MPRVSRYPRVGVPSSDELVGKIITIPPIDATRWYVAESFRKGGQSRLRLLSIPNGKMSIVHLGTVKGWIEQGRIVITEDIPAQVTAAA